MGTLRGVGRIYMQVVVDTYGSFAFAKLNNAKLAITAADLVYDPVLPFYEAKGLAVEAILAAKLLAFTLQSLELLATIRSQRGRKWFEMCPRGGSHLSWIKGEQSPLLLTIS